MKNAVTDQRFRLTASAVASYFKHHCDRLFRWNSVEGPNRGRAGIGWNVPARARKHSRPGILLLMQAGDLFEVENVEQLIAEAGADQVLMQGFEMQGSRRLVRSMSLPDFVEALRQPALPHYIAQIEIAFDEDRQQRFLQRFDLDFDHIKLGPARPDLIELLPSTTEEGTTLLRVWDFKGSRVARHEHFMQVAYYSFLLEQVIAEFALTNVRVDTEFGVIRSRTETVEFELAPYRLAIDDFLRNRVPHLLNTPAADAHYHVQEGCAMCDYMETCRSEADAGRDLSRIAGMTSESKRRLRRAGIVTHRELAALHEQNGDAALVERLRQSSHDLSMNIHRYLATARSLEDGLPRSLASSTLLMPRYENVRVVLTAEQDAVTGICFAIGMKTFEGWDDEKKRVIGNEHVFITASPDDEGEMLLRFLTELNGLLRRVDRENREVEATPIDEHHLVAEALAVQRDAEERLVAFKAAHNPIRKNHPDYETLIAERNRLEQEVKEAKGVVRQAKKDAGWERRRMMSRLHFYVYDSLDLLALRSAIERHIFTTDRPELLEELKTLVRLFPPSSVMRDAETFRSIPGTIVTEVLRNTVALPTPYGFDLKSVSERYQPTGADGEERGWVFNPRYGFGWEYSNQIAYERIHDVWNGATFEAGSDRLSPEEILRGIETTAVSKLRATDSIVRRLKSDLGDQLLLRKEPFRLYEEFDPTDFRMLDALRVFAMLETSLEELGVKHLHTLPLEDRAAKLQCIRGLRYVGDGAEETLWFEFDPLCRDARFGPGEFNLVATPEDEPQMLASDLDGPLFDRAGWRYANFKTTLVEYDLAAEPPRLCLKPDNPAKFRESLDLGRPLVLDQIYIDYNTHRVIDTLHRLQSAPADARHIHELITDARVQGWHPFIEDVDAVERELRALIASTDAEAASSLNPGQWLAWRGVFAEPLTMIWGPPGTGKTHTVAYILLGYAMAAKMLKRPMRILVTAFTHNAIANVLKKIATLVERCGLKQDDVMIVKVGRESNADGDLPESVGRINEDALGGFLIGDGCIIVGATVWGTYKAMEKSGGVVRPWFDVVLVDEASQLRLPDALIALAAGKPTGNIILAGDDMQLPPIIHGEYPEEHEHMLSSVFAFMRGRMAERGMSEPDAEKRMLFQLEENFRMNEPLTAYPRDILYRGRYSSTKPEVRITLNEDARGGDDTSVVESVLRPDRAAVICWYTPPRSFTARNPVEAELAALLVARLGQTLIDERTGLLYDPRALADEGVAVLSPHRAQNSSIRQALVSCGFGSSERPLPIIDTVDKLQGQERDVVLVSYGVADEEYADAEAEFLLSRNRFNVAVTRARHKAIVLCSDTVLDAVPTDRRVLLESMMLKEFRSYCSDGHLELPWRSEELGEELLLHVQWRGF